MPCYIVKQLVKKRMVPGVLLDVSAVFNCVRHSYFLSMLRFLGYDDAVVKWFGSYLAGKQQAIEVCRVRSEWADLSIGTPQGSAQFLDHLCGKKFSVVSEGYNF